MKQLIALLFMLVTSLLVVEANIIDVKHSEEYQIAVVDIGIDSDIYTVQIFKVPIVAKIERLNEQPDLLGYTFKISGTEVIRFNKVEYCNFRPIVKNLYEVRIRGDDYLNLSNITI